MINLTIKNGETRKPTDMGLDLGSVVYIDPPPKSFTPFQPKRALTGEDPMIGIQFLELRGDKCFDLLASAKGGETVENI